MNTADFLNETDPGCTVFVIGEGGLLTALHECKIANDAIKPRYVVVGEGAPSTEKLAKAHECIERGAGLLATNPDIWCPVSSEKNPARGRRNSPRFLKPARGAALIISESPMVTCSIARVRSWPIFVSMNWNVWL